MGGGGCVWAGEGVCVCACVCVCVSVHSYSRLFTSVNLYTQSVNTIDRLQTSQSIALSLN